MSIAATVITVLSGDSYIASEVGGRVYNMRAKQGTPPPYIVISFPAMRQFVHLRGVAQLTNPRLRVDFFGRNYAQLHDIHAAVVVAISSSRELTGVPSFYTELYEDDTSYFHLVQDFSLWVTG